MAFCYSKERNRSSNLIVQLWSLCGVLLLKRVYWMFTSEWLMPQNALEDFSFHLISLLWSLEATCEVMHHQQIADPYMTSVTSRLFPELGGIDAVSGIASRLIRDPICLITSREYCVSVSTCFDDWMLIGDHTHMKELMTTIVVVMIDLYSMS